MDLSVGTLVKIKPEAWNNYLLRNGLDIEKPLPSTRVVTSMPNHPPYIGYVMLDFPLYWWKESEVEIVDQ